MSNLTRQLKLFNILVTRFGFVSHGCYLIKDLGDKIIKIHHTNLGWTRTYYDNYGRQLSGNYPAWRMVRHYITGNLTA